MRDQRCGIQQQRQPLYLVRRSHSTQHSGVQPDWKGGDKKKWNDSVEYAESGGAQIVFQNAQGGKAAGLRCNRCAVNNVLDIGQQRITHIGKEQARPVEYERNHRKSDGSVFQVNGQWSAQECKRLSILFVQIAHVQRFSNFSMPTRIRRSVSSFPRIWQISTAPPGVTALPAVAIRTGHISLAFFIS